MSRLLRAIKEYRNWFDTCSKTQAPDWQDLAAEAIDNLDSAVKEYEEYSEYADSLFSKPVLLLIKSQIAWESSGNINQLYKAGVDVDYISHLVRLDKERLKACNTAKEISDYLIESRRLTLHEWLDSLSPEHVRS